MKAIVNTKYGAPDVLQLKEVERPTPEDNEVLLKVYETSVNAGDWHLLRAKPFLMRLMSYGLLKPKHTILGDFRLQACIESQGNVCHERRFRGSLIPGHVPGAIDFKNWETENG